MLITSLTPWYGDQRGQIHPPTTPGGINEISLNQQRQYHTTSPLSHKRSQTQAIDMHKAHKMAHLASTIRTSTEVYQSKSNLFREAVFDLVSCRHLCQTETTSIHLKRTPKIDHEHELVLIFRAFVLYSQLSHQPGLCLAKSDKHLVLCFSVSQDRVEFRRYGGKFS
jgi:hypothetical protein